MFIATTAHADPLSIDGTWYPQYELMPASGADFSTTYTATEPESVEITGYYDNTDQYNVYVDGSLVLTTPTVAAPRVDYGDTFGTYTDPSTAWNSGLFSQGIFTVNTADTILIQDIGPLYPSAFGPNEYDAQVGVQAVPEPFGTTAFSLAFAIVAVARRRRALARNRLV